MAGGFNLTKTCASKVLMYHGVYSEISSRPFYREEGAEIYDVSAEDFEAQISWLKEQGYTTGVNQEDEAKKITITFDDGEMNNFKEAFPILKRYGFTAYFFIIAQRIGKKGYMGWNEIKKMMDAGMRIGSHGLTHSILTKLKDSHLEEELEGSKRTLENNLNRTIEDLSIPRGFYNDRIIEKALQTGYRRVFVTERGYRSKLPCITRIAVKKNWSLKKFKMIVLNKTPWGEIVFNTGKKAVKSVLREDGYNRLRGAILRII
jgi:peptidoglycan/xylan/chitin deacetylase (PgdA/CDA1 family)